MTNNPFAPKPSSRAFRRMKLGDKVHAIAQPIAHVVDEVFGTEIQSCGSCAKRREKLNNIFQSELDK